MSKLGARQPTHEYQRFLQSLPNEWGRAELRTLGTVVGGGTPSRGVPSFWQGNIPWVTPGEISGNVGKFLYNTSERISASGLAGSGANLLPAGSLLVTTRATLGARVINAAPMATNQGFKSIVFKQAADSGFYFHLFQRMKSELVRRASGTTFLEISASEFASLEVPLPDQDEKRVITSVIDTLDTVIHETEALIAKLKAVKQGLLHDLLTRGIDANGELRPLQAEAPHLYKQSPLGWIPKGWAFGELQTWLNGRPRNGYSPQVAGEWTGIQMLGLGCLTHEGFEPLQLKPAPRGDRRLVPAMLADGDLLVSRSNTRDLVGLAGVYRDVGTPCSYPDLMMRLNASDETRGEFLELVLRSPQLRRQIEAHAVGTSGSMVKVSGRIVSALMVTMPPIDEQERILICLNAARSRIDAEIEELSTLHELKSGLMDDLLTGRVRVTPLLASESEGSA